MPVRVAAMHVAVLAGVLGVGLALALLPAPGAAVLLATGAGAGWAWSCADGAWPGWMWSSTLVVPFTVLGAAGWLAAGAPGAVLTAGALTVGAALWGRRVRRAHSRSYPVSAPPLPSWGTPTAAADGEDLGRWSDADLCRVWRQTNAQVAAATGAEALLMLSECRNAVLTELERRNPRGFATWIASGASAAGNPEPYLQ